jgi:hypothetical protein
LSAQRQPQVPVRPIILVDGATFAQFQTLFDAPPQPSDGLRRLIALKPPWDKPT